ncbi:hypothetical protein DFH07DRAFT_962190 [Mycena maculata]|uniref:Uncharacterized protein n=1 Tax=Mycena maculata TaxID=230809 RepID=A0AAD7IQS1_9AGAR|nr:hypothetical protein DFH07DRAFT_962190 [Mycena maculata]
MYDKAIRALMILSWASSSLFVLELVGSIATVVIFVRYPTFAQSGRVDTPVTIWLVNSASTDIAIALASSSPACPRIAAYEIIFQEPKEWFVGMQHTLLVPPTLHLYQRHPWLIRDSLQTGTISSIVTRAVGLSFFPARVYTLTLLYNLRTRPRLSDTTRATDFSGVANIVVDQPRDFAVGAASEGGGHVRQTVIIDEFAETKSPEGDPWTRPSFDDSREGFESV